MPRRAVWLGRLALVTSLVSRGSGAQAVFEDVKGRAALMLPASAGIFGVNTGDASLQLGFTRLASAKPLLFGGSIRGKATDGTASLFQAGRVSPDVGTTLWAGFKPGNSGGTVVGLLWRRDWAGATVIDSTAKPVPTIEKRTLGTWELSGRLQLAMPRGALPWFAAVSVGNRSSNNYADLPKVTVRTLRGATDPSQGTSVSIERTVDGRAGTLVSERLTFADADILLIPRGRLPVSTRLFVRGLLARPDGSSQRNSGGIDFGVHKDKGDPILDRLAALVVQVDEARPTDKRRKLQQRTSVAVVANLAPIIGKLVALVSP